MDPSAWMPLGPRSSSEPQARLLFLEGSTSPPLPQHMAAAAAADMLSHATVLLTCRHAPKGPDQMNNERYVALG